MDNLDIYLNKKVKVQFPNGDKMVGICTFIGYNEILNVNQITLNRTPLWPLEELKIELI